MPLYLEPLLVRGRGAVRGGTGVRSEHRGSNFDRQGIIVECRVGVVQREVSGEETARVHVGRGKSEGSERLLCGRTKIR